MQTVQGAAIPAVVAVLAMMATPACADKETLDTARLEIAFLKTEMSVISERLNAIERENARKASLTPGSDGYSLVDTDLGPLAVSLENIQPYANGSRVTLDFGNLTPATMNGVMAKLHWGSMGDDNAEQSGEFRFAESFQRGSWTRVSVVLEKLPPTQLGYVRVDSVSHQSIQLFR